MRADPPGSDDHERKNHHDVNARHPEPQVAKSVKGKRVVVDRPRESQRRRSAPHSEPIDFQDPVSGRKLAAPLGNSARGLPFPDEGFICCEANASAACQALASAYPVDLSVHRHEPEGVWPSGWGGISVGG
ncbi:hypothetical protein Dimus_030139 [Dionaea muscipula]